MIPGNLALPNVVFNQNAKQGIKKKKKCMCVYIYVVLWSILSSRQRLFGYYNLKSRAVLTNMVVATSHRWLYKFKIKFKIQLFSYISHNSKQPLPYWTAQIQNISINMSIGQHQTRECLQDFCYLVYLMYMWNFQNCYSIKKTPN